MSETLPPKPDPHTGYPLPPRAPLERGWKRSEDRHERDASTVPQPPPGYGPVLEWYRSTPGRGTTMGLILSVIMLAFFTFRDWGLGWMSTWWLWLFVMPWPLVFLLRERRLRISAGADWLAYNKGFVRTYELTKVHVTVGGAAHQLILEDSHGSKLEYLPIHELQLNRELWDLVYLGLLHSTFENSADVNNMAKSYLSLSVPPHLREWEYR